MAELLGRNVTYEIFSPYSKEVNKEYTNIAFDCIKDYVESDCILNTLDVGNFGGYYFEWDDKEIRELNEDYSDYNQLVGVRVPNKDYLVYASKFAAEAMNCIYHVFLVLDCGNGDEVWEFTFKTTKLSKKNFSEL